MTNEVTGAIVAIFVCSMIGSIALVVIAFLVSEMLLEQGKILGLLREKKEKP